MAGQGRLLQSSLLGQLSIGTSEIGLESSAIVSSIPMDDWKPIADVKRALERMGSPSCLVLTKTTGSFERATQQFEADCQWLKILEGVNRGSATRKGKS